MPFNLSRRPNPKIGITTADFCYVSKQSDIPVAEIRTVDEVESAGSGFLTSSQRPKLLFEGHYFYKQLKRHGLAQKAAKLQPTLCYPTWTSRFYVGREGEYVRIAKATELCHHFGISDAAALNSASWGRYQIMGANYRLAGYDSVEAFVEAMFQDEMRHLEAFAEYINSSMLDDELRQHRWAAFALAYNGPGYKRNNYHIKLPNAFARFSRMRVDCSSLEHVVSAMPGDRSKNPAPHSFANTSLDSRYVSLSQGPADPPPTVENDPEGSIGSLFPSKPAYPPVERPNEGTGQLLPPENDPFSQTVEQTVSVTQSPSGETTLEGSVTVPAGDPPSAEPSHWYSVEDWKPFVKRWLARVWGGNVTTNVGQSFMNLVGAVRDPEHWYVYVGIAVAIFFLLIFGGVLVSAVLVGIWFWNRREISTLKATELQLRADPNMKNVGLVFEKK
jgi:hypothetical protein